MNISFFWFRRDLRLKDNAALYHALKSGVPIQPIFIFDRHILDKLEDKDDSRVTFIHQTLQQLKKELQELGSDLWVYYDKPEKIWKELLTEHKVQAIFSNRDYEPYAISRDKKVRSLANKQGAEFKQYKDQVIFEQDEVLKDDGDPYVVFTPYSKKWKAKLDDFYIKPYPTEKYFDALHQGKKKKMPSLKQMGFEKSSIPFPATETTSKIIREYHDKRDYPGINGTSMLSVHFRFGTISIRDKINKALKTSDTWLNELIWRDFYAMILYKFPQVVGNAFRPKYDEIKWRNAPKEFEAWCQGKTGYPIVDAGMRQLNETGWMHNRVRMIVASFLTKHLLIDWRKGEAYFARRLIDFDLASNNGGWQWAAGCGVDAAPYFRIFNPHTQLTKFDKSLAYVKRWVPEYGSDAYVPEIVEHKFARERCLETYKKALK